MVTKRLFLGPSELRLLLTLEQEGRTLFNSSDAKRILANGAAARKVVSRLKRKGRIEEIERGKYLLVPARAGYEGAWSEAPVVLVPHLIREGYVGLWSALNHWGMTESVPRTVFVVTPKRKRDVEFGPTRFEFITVSRRKFFGFVEEKAAGGPFRISTQEKTIVDCLAMPRYCGGLGEVAKAVWRARRDLDFDALVSLAERYGVSAVLRRLGYLLEALSLAPRARARIRARGFRGYQWLDPLGPKRPLGYAKEYGLILNRTKEELREWRR